jgi:hypothetical protein
MVGLICALTAIPAVLVVDAFYKRSAGAKLPFPATP